MLDEFVDGKRGPGIIGEQGYGPGFVLVLFSLPSPISSSVQHDQGVGQQALSGPDHTAPAGITAEAFPLCQIP